MDAVVVSDVFGTRAGAYTATLLLCRGLEELGVDVTCFATWVDPDFSVNKEPFAVVTPRVGRGSRWDWPNRCLALQVVRHVRKNKPALVIVMGVIRLSRYLLKSEIADRLLIWELTNGCANKFVDEEAGRMLPRCKAMLSPSMTIDRNIRAHYDYKGVILRLPFWIEDENLPFIKRPSKFLADFVYFGRRDEEKGLRDLVQATAIVAREFPAVRVVIGGVGDAEPFASLARDLNIKDCVTIGSFPARGDVTRAMAGSRCLVLPSYHEGYPLVLLEAARSSLPFVSTDVGSVREVFGDCSACILVEPQDPGSLAEGMTRVLRASDDVYYTWRKSAYESFNKLSSSERVAKNLSFVLEYGGQPSEKSRSKPII